MSNGPTRQRVHIEFQRVQGWLFSVPRLRAMVGANCLIGETLRVDLRDLARMTDRGWTLAGTDQIYPEADPGDPIGDHDDPAADARAGILSRDGGHFEAQFESGAQAFSDAAAQLLRSKLPGLRFRISIDGEARPQSAVQLSTELPVLAPCEWTGRGLASALILQGEEPHVVSMEVKQRHDAAMRSENGSAVDIASLLSARTSLGALDRPQKLEDLVGDGYLALIHADGNGVGGGLGKDMPENERAAFFHRNRVLLRRAVKTAVDIHCPETGPAPLILLMLGGDDLLLMTRAEIALPFVVTLCEALAALQDDDHGFKLTLGVGVVIAKHTIPIQRLHEVAETLAESAKRRFRGFTDGAERRSVVDWAVYSTSWIEDPGQVRRRNWLCGAGDHQGVLSQRPVDVLGEKLDSLQGLVSRASQLTCARSQLRFLVDELPRGRWLSELAFADLPQETSDALRKADVKELWRRAGASWITPLLDLVEISEIARPTRGGPSEETSRERADGR